MGKTKLQYRTQPCPDLATGRASETKRTPRIVNLRTYETDELVRFALDNNYIEGSKYELAKGIAKGLIEAERALVKAGNAVSIDGWVRYEPRLKGTVDAEKRTLTSANRLVVGITALKELKLSRDAFGWQCVDDDMPSDGGEGGATPAPAPVVPAPTLTGIHGPGEASPVLIPGGDIFLEGTNLALGEGDRIEVRNAASEGEWYDLTEGYVDPESSATTLQIMSGAWECPAFDGIADYPNMSFRVTKASGAATIVGEAKIDG